LEAALGRHESAEPKLRGALALARRRGFQSFVAQGHFELGNFLARAGRAAEARESWQASAALAEKCGMIGLVSRVGARLAGAEAAVMPASTRRSHGVAVKLTMVREGELYRLERGSCSARIRASRGAELLARLIDAPHQEIHVLALAADEGAPTTESNAGDNVDRAALRQYRARLGDLSQLVAEAERHGDAGRAEAFGRERAALERELARALGLGGRARKAGSVTERARVNVQRRLKDALERVTDASPELGAWLSRALRTGTYCSFNPTH
jgi:hypothetical protein